MDITEKALIARINRRLADGGTMLRKSRGAQLRAEAGDVHELDVSCNAIVSKHVDAEQWGRELGVIGASDRVV